MPTKSFSETIKEIFDLRGVTTKKLSELTDISEIHLSALASGNLSKLPPFPYVRGYIIKIAEVLNVDSSELIDLYKKESFINKNINVGGANDRLPVNRFAREIRSKKKIIIGIAALLIAVYGFFWAKNFLGIPKIKIINPVNDNIIISSSTIIQLSGQGDNFFDKLFINGEEVAMDKSGFFEKDYKLEPGANNIEFRLKRFLGREIIVDRKIFYKP